MNTDIPQTNSRSRDPRRFARRRRGIALIITLTIMALLLIMATSLLVNMRTERTISANFADQIQARETALAGLHTAIAHMDNFFVGAVYSNALIATMPGRFYAVPLSAGVTPPFAYTNSSMISFTNAFSMLPPGKISYLGNFATRYCNLNNASYEWGKRYLPIFNPLRTPNISPANPTEITYAEVYADFLPLFRRENNIMYDTSTLGGLTATNSMWGGYLTGRFAYWIDDESVKVNIGNSFGKNTWNDTNFNTNFVPLKSPMVYGSMRSQGDVLPPSPLAGQSVTSTVDPGALDYNTISALAGNWGTLVTEMDQAQNTGGQWRPFQTPEDALGVCGSLTMEQYQAAKFCLTTWSEDRNNFSQIFRKNGIVDGALMTRTNLGAGNTFLFPLTTSVRQAGLYNFIRTQLNSARLRACFAGASFVTKYPDTTQPYIGGGVDQIAANIVSYLSDVGGTPGVAPYLAAPSYGVPPTGPVGLWKAAYMNEIALSFCLQKVAAPGGGSSYKLWAGAFIELINPYEISLPRVNQSYRFEGTFQFVPTLKPGATFAPSATPAQLLMTLTSADALPLRSYSQPIKDKIHWQSWDVGTITLADPKSVTPPEIEQITITVPVNAYIRQRSLQPAGLVDWFDPAQDVNNKNITFKLPNLATIVCKPAGPLPIVAAQPANNEFWDSANNKSIISIAKNDPRVRAWYGPFGPGSAGGTAVTIKGFGSATGQNLIAPITQSSGAGGPVDHTGGDYETTNGGAPTNANRPIPETWSNFVIAEGPMKSVGELGFIHTGKPWRSLSLQYVGAQEDERISTTSVVLIPDWVLMDLFSVNTPPIHGRINVNNSGWQGEYANSADQQSTVSESRSVPNLYPPWISPGRGASISPSTLTTGTPFGRQVPCSSPSARPLSRTLCAALNFIGESGSGGFGNAGVRNQLVDAIVLRRPPQANVWVQTGSDTPMCNPWRPYLTIGELCEVYRMNYFDLTQTSLPRAYTDAAREETIRRIANVLTTNSDVFAVHVVGESRGVSNIRQGEARLMAIVQRYVTVPPNATSIRNCSQKWRIRHMRWITE